MQKIKFYFSICVFLFVTISFSERGGKNFCDANESGLFKMVNDSIPFLICAYDDGAEKNISILRDELNFNLWHSFTRNRISYKGYWEPLGWEGKNNADSLYFPNNTTNPVVEDVLNSNGNSLRTLMQRPKIEWLFFAQRSDYQCVEENNLDNRDYNWFYTYRCVGGHKGSDIQDNSGFGQGVKVRYCHSGNPDGRDSGYVVKDLYANREQINSGNPGHGYPYPGFGDAQSKWYIKPRIRINAEFANNPVNINVKVCRIEILRYDGSIIKTSDILVSDFTAGQTYNGNYKEDFYTQNNNLIIESGQAFNPNNIDWTDRSYNCKVDFRLFWYGRCEMWINYIRVDNDRANDLFGDTLTNNTCLDYHHMIQREALDAKNINDSPLMYYVDEFEFNHIPAISYVMKKLQQYAGTQKPPFVLATNCPMDFYELHLPWDKHLSLEHFKRYCLDSCKVSLYGLSNSYPFYLYEYPTTHYLTRLPSSLPNVTGNNIFADVITPVEYDNWLQHFVDSISPFIKGCRQLEYISHLKPEMHTFFSIHAFAENHRDSKSGVSGVRETTNEEIRMMVNTSLSYGMKGIFYYWYGAFGQNEDGTVNIDNFGVSLSNRLGANANLTPRFINFYGQRKWEYIVQTNNILKQWGPYLVSFNSEFTNSYTYHKKTERDNLLENSYFANVISFKYGSKNTNCSEENSPPGLTYDCADERYIQVAIFRNSEQYSRYFMIVNRRCSPDTLNGNRFLRVQFKANSLEFTGFNNWKIINVFNNSTVVTFDKRVLSNIDLGWFKPAEGNLYKIVPQ